MQGAVGLSKSFSKLTKLKEHLQDLTEEEAYLLTRSMLTGELSIPKSSAFLTAMRIKGETHEELMGVMRALKEIRKPLSGTSDLDLSLNYDGKNKSLYILPSAVFIVSECGLRLTYHYGDRVPAKEGVTLKEVLDKVVSELKIDMPLRTTHQREFAPELYNLMPLRRELGFRTFINVLEKLLNPFNSPRVVTSLFHKPYFKKMSELCSSLNFKSYTLIKGLEGGVEPLTDRPTYYSKNSERVESFNPKGKGIKLPKDVNTDDVLGSSVDINLKVLKGNAKAEFLNWALLSAGFLIFSADMSNTISEGFRKAQECYSRLLRSIEG